MNEPAQPIEIAATAVQARSELAFTASAQKARLSYLNLVHSLQLKISSTATICLWTFWTPPSAMYGGSCPSRLCLRPGSRNCHKSSSGRPAARLVTLGNVLSSMTTALAPALSYAPIAWMTLIASHSLCRCRPHRILQGFPSTYFDTCHPAATRWVLRVRSLPKGFMPARK